MSIKELSLSESPDVSFESKEFKRKQLEILLIGGQIDVERFSGGDLTSSFLNSSEDNNFGHVAIINLKKIGCDFNYITFESGISVLDSHKKEDSVCNSCISTRRKEADISKGIVNQFTCWRRGHTSQKFGFLLKYVLESRSDNLELRHKTTLSSREMISSFFRNKVMYSRTKQVSKNYMAITIDIDLEGESVSNNISELNELLSQQMLVSKNMPLKMSSNSNQTREHREKIPEFIKSLLQKVHDEWQFNGPSRNSTGITNVFLIKNTQKSIDSSTFENMLQSFSNKIRANFECLDLFKLNKNTTDDLSLSDLSSGSSTLCILLDTIVDLTGGEDIGQ
tara:strand:- start:578 stop:1588 length:1011 start_codon:yes stop_codon:yes gene_type:complete